MRTMLCTSPSPWSTTYCYVHHVVYITKSLEYNLLLCAPCCVHHQVLGVQPTAMRTMLCTSPSHWSTTYCYAHHVVYITKSLEYNLLLCAPCCVHHQVIGVQPIAMRTMLYTSPSPWSTTYCYAHHVVYITKSLEYNILLCAPCCVRTTCCCVHHQVLGVQHVAMRTIVYITKYCYAHHVVYITKSLEYLVQPIAMRTMLCASPSPWSTTYCYAHHVVYITKSLEYNLLLCAPCCVHHQVLGVQPMCCVHHQVLGVQPIVMRTKLCASPSPWSTTYCYAHHVVYITKSLEYNLLLCAPCCVHHQVLGVQPIAMCTMLCTSPSHWSTTYCYAHHVVYITKSLEYNLLLCAPCCVHHQVLGVQPIAMRTMLCTSPSPWSTTYCYAHHVVYFTKSL